MELQQSLTLVREAVTEESSKEVSSRKSRQNNEEEEEDLCSGEGHSWRGGETTVINFRIQITRRFLPGKFVTTLQCKEEEQNPDKF